ncbi:MAG: hypothetical protein A3B30_02905 [Candidatus Komeilibacteria bacterium RIFCSPLOWO2_01_FULL_52_15]|uniref:Glycosyltransferase RgtA/B/C/D-like domain-containing protein n=2 Tax=Candidatus Komeiliibacteriota TaxID=1817908 RepID=A0A1G2BTS1_9BACT|nr:MAG: hypothetical protein A2677_02310 [Candidatus Komeilibacteria bacterium RIFCSPHIGHO2_01_FULL_52_14]OGY91637.1 MAG: hypothetical protein A3B30_02905 [Candidatus Komeilibacteria bacterium RIFCSPLOWO2_01_FULL_52_15]
MGIAERSIAAIRGSRGILLLLFFASILALLCAYFFISRSDAFYDLAVSFTQGRLDVVPPQLPHDYVLRTAKYYWAPGPFPSLLYIPFALLQTGRGADFLSFALTMCIAYLFFRLSRAEKLSVNSSLWLSFAFTFASPMLGVLSFARASYVAHLIVVAALAAILLEYASAKRYLLIGFLYGVILATRGTAVLSIIFFILDAVIRYRYEPKKMLRALCTLAAPVVVFLVLIFWYNYARFDSIFETGYGMAFLGEDLQAMRDMGLFGLVHLPANLYYFFLAGPLPITRPPAATLVFPYITNSGWGLGIIFTAPYLLSLFWRSIGDRTEQLLWLGVLCAALPVFLYYGVGALQLGYRYALDFLPLIYFIFLRTLKNRDGEVPAQFKKLFAAVYFFNLYLVFVQVKLMI